MKEKSKPDLPPHSQEEDDRINAGVAADPDTFEADAEWFRNAGPVRDAYAAEGPPRPAPGLLERARKTDPALAQRLEEYARRADEWERGQGGRAAALKTRAV